MKLEDLEAKLGISSDLSDEERLALVKDLQTNLPSLKNNLVKIENQTQANLVKQAIKKIQENLENRFNELSGFVDKKANSITNGRDGLQGPKGDKGDRGLNGTPGIQGPQGVPGKEGQQGEQGIGVADARVDFDGALIITLTDGTEINAGEVLPFETTEKLKVYFNNPAVSGGTSLPDQAGNSGKYLTTDGTTASWGTVSGSGTVTSVAVSGGTTGLTTSGGPVTSSGTITLAGTLAVANGGTGATTLAGASIATYTGTETLSNKTVVQRVVSIADATSITINADTTDIATQANTQTAGTLTVNAPTGTPVNGQKLVLRLQSTNIQTFSWNAIFAGSTDLVLPVASTGSSKYDYVGFIYNSTAAKWQLLAKVFGF